MDDVRAQVVELDVLEQHDLVGEDAVHAHAAKALIYASETAELLVVGTRGIGGFKNLVLGSVAEQCIRHAASSVLVVRG